MALRIAIDTNRYRDYVSGKPEAHGPVARAEHVFIPFVVLAELRSGFILGSQQRENEVTLVRILSESAITVLFPDEATTHFYAELFVELRRAGTPIPTNDLWIAALVIQHDLVLFTRDQHFERVARVPRL